MLNQIVLVGRLVSDPQINETKENKKTSVITLAVPRSYKNTEGIYETDFIPCILWQGVAQTTAEYCKKGDMVGIKGRMQTKTIENKNGEKEHKIEIVAEKLTFLSSKKGKEEE